MHKAAGMWRLVKYLEENKEEIISFVDSIPRAEYGITEKLAEIWPDGSDKERQELADAVMAAMWLGYRAKGKEAASFFRDCIFEAFEAGKRYAMMQ